MISKLLRRAIVALLASILATPAAAQSVPDLVLAGRFDDARAELDARGASPLDRAFTEALIARRAGNTGEAIARLRNIVRARPDVVPARQLLANLLFTTGQYEAAEFHYRRLVEDDPENRAGYNRALRAIAAQKPFGFGLSGALVPSTNINRGTNSDIFTTGFGDFVIADESQSATGVGLAVTGSVFRRFQLADDRQLQFDAIVGAIVYEQAEFNQHSYTLRATLSQSRDTRGWSIAPEYTRAYLAGALSYNRYALRLARAVPLGEDTAFRLSGLAEHRDYTTDTFLTGQRYEVEGTLRRRLDPRTALEGSLAYKLGETEAERFRYNGIEVGARVARAFESGLQLGIGLSHEWRPYRGDFTGVDFPRDDRILSVDFTVFNDRWTISGAAPTYSCRLTWATSNIAFYDYDVAECTIGFTRAF